MRILVVSDSHGDRRRLREAVAAQPQAAAVIHLGDGLREAQDVADEYPSLPFFVVRGNCDFGLLADDAPTSRLERLGGVRVFCTHGHLYDVKYGLLRVELAAREQQARVLLHGHTHLAYTDYQDGLYSMNPGCLAQGYGLLDITPQGILPHLVEVDR